MPAWLFLLGFISIVSQVVILRELAVAYYGVELIYLVAIGIWLLGTGMGSLLGRRHSYPFESSISWLFLLFALLIPLDIVFIRGLRHLFGGVYGAYLAIPAQVAGLMLALIPLGIILGLLFQWIAHFRLLQTKTLASTYAMESLGAILGGVASSIFMSVGLQNLQIGLLCSLIIVLTAISLQFLGSRKRNILPFPLLILLGIAFYQAAPVDLWLTGWNHGQLLTSRDTPYGRLTVTGTGRQIAVYENDALSFETEGTSAEELVHLAALQSPHPNNVLILGNGIEGTVYEMQKHSPLHLDYVDLDPVLLSVVTPLLPDPITRSLQAEGTRVICHDPRRTLETMGKYDLIIVGMADPFSAQSNRYYTKEFFSITEKHLVVNGVLAFRLRSSENFWTKQLTMRNSSIVNSLRAVFPSVEVLPGSTNIILAGKTSLCSNPDTLSSRFRARGIQTHFVSPEYIHYLYTNDRYSEIQTQLVNQSVPENTDNQPVCFRYAVSIWLSKFFPRLYGHDSATAQTPEPSSNRQWLISAIVLAMAFVLVRWKTSLSPVFSVGIAGFCGMLIETLLLLRYQIKCGVLYQDIGLLLTLFMTGLALGAMIIDKLLRMKSLNESKQKHAGLVVMSLFIVLSLLIGLDRSGWMEGIVGTGILLALAGSMVSANFALVGQIPQRASSKWIASLYSADLIGGAAGTILGSIILVPAVGITGTAGVVSLISALSLILFL